MFVFLLKAFVYLLSLKLVLDLRSGLKLVIGDWATLKM